MSGINLRLPKHLGNEIRPIWLNKYGPKGRAKWVREVTLEFLVDSIVTNCDFSDKTNESAHILIDLLENSANSYADKTNVTSEKIDFDSKIVDDLNRLRDSLKHYPRKMIAYSVTISNIINTAINLHLTRLDFSNQDEK